MTTDAWRCLPGSFEEDIYQRLIAQMSRRGKQVDLPACAALAKDIQQYGHEVYRVRYAAEALGLNPQYLPRRRGGPPPEPPRGEAGED